MAVRFCMATSNICGSSVWDVRHVPSILRRLLDFRKFVLASYSIQSVPGGKDLTSGECSLGQTTPI
jgi:hypothetical protein